MHRSSVLTASTLLGLAMLAPAAQALPASAPVPVCNGARATMVGTGATVTGTEGDDVIVIGPATTVHALGGDDQICVSSDGAVIDGTTEPAAVRQIDAGAGEDEVLLTTESLAAGSSIDLGDGSDTLVAAQAGGFLALDLQEQSLEVDRALVARVIDGDDAYLLAPDVDLQGDGSSNTLTATSCDARLRGGPGNDVLRSLSGDATWDVYALDCDEQRLDAEAGAGDDLIRGSQGDDRLLGNGGADRIEGRGGRDGIEGNKDDDVLDGGDGRDTVRGNGGADRATGGAGADWLDGGAGRDRVDGARGRDRCVAEVERRCER
ncbi:calcium-binding protein [Nocardioides okcheonensis]|uniref:calcium-binding protein n=1 Tax=Nocardioides okcheonensis TaxID=2894081 RepID=UPI001E357C22|nr:hypothetical protein [Nocardioides okcheonensis]UFN44058.1 hypothetical protein LN652_18725 [Nocardioides okcheonensis]